jgi:hypothetical protein
MFRLSADPYCSNSYIYWKRKYYPSKGFPPMENYEQWLKENFNCTDNGGDYVYFHTRFDKFMYEATFKNELELK